MIKSMTGYGRFEGVIDGRNVVFEIKSVNHRFLELTCRTPRGCGFIEETIKNLVSEYVTRGKTDVYVSIEADDELAAEYKTQFPPVRGGGKGHKTRLSNAAACGKIPWSEKRKVRK